MMNYSKVAIAQTYSLFAPPGTCSVISASAATQIAASLLAIKLVDIGRVFPYCFNKIIRNHKVGILKFTN